MAILLTGSSGAVKSIIPTSTREITAVMLWQQCSMMIIWIGGLAFEISKIKALPPDSEFKLHQDISISLHLSFSSISFPFLSLVSIHTLFFFSLFFPHTPSYWNAVAVFRAQNRAWGLRPANRPRAALTARINGNNLIHAACLSMACYIPCCN